MDWFVTVHVIVTSIGLFAFLYCMYLGVKLVVMMQKSKVKWAGAISRCVLFSLLGQACNLVLELGYLITALAMDPKLVFEMKWRPLLWSIGFMGGHIGFVAPCHDIGFILPHLLMLHLPCMHAVHEHTH